MGVIALLLLLAEVQLESLMIMGWPMCLMYLSVLYWPLLDRICINTAVLPFSGRRLTLED